MGLMKKISDYKYERYKRKQERKLEKFNHRQEKLNDIYKNEKQKSDFKSLLSRLKFETYTKRLVAVVVFISLLDLQLSYVLAFLDKVQIAESLSNQICVTLLGTILVYVIRAHFDTKAEKRDELIKSGYITDKSTLNNINDIINNKIQEIICNSGVSEHIDNDSTLPETENPEDSNFCG